MPMPRLPVAAAVLAVLAVLAAGCVPVDDARQDTAATRFTARGNEPGWRVDIDGDRITFVGQDGRRVAATLPAPARTGAITRYVAADLTVTIFDRRCRDSMTGMPHPNAVAVVLDGRELAGCGGDPATLLQGAEWIVTDVAGKAVAGGARPTLNFGRDGRVYGRGSCNSYTAEYALTGEGLTIAKAAGTMMACETALMQQDSLFLGVLRDVRGFDVRDDGALVLRAGDGRTIVARR
jgi:heat shock protein HslJ